MIGRTINQYKILDQLGEGGMGIVYLAEDTRLHRKAALKFISGSARVTAEERKRFNREAQAAARLSHPNICTVYELGENEDQVFIALEYVEGETLKERMQRGPISNEEIRNWLEQIAEGLLAAHEQGVIHRDVKPANIMITSKGHVKIMDFGIAKLSEVETELTQGNSTIGTIAYMSPEQAKGEVVDHRTDIWALGVILYEMTTGRRPFAGAFSEAVMYAMMHEDVPAPSTINPDVPENLEHIINRCLQREREKRYDSLEELLHDLRGKEGAAFETKPAAELAVPVSKSDQEARIRSTRGGATTGLTWSTIIDTRQKRLVAGGLVVLVAILALILPDFRGFITGSPSTGALPSAMHLAVLPFDIIGNNPEDEAFANGLAHLVATNLVQMDHDGIEMWIIPVREILSQQITSTKDAKESFGINLAISGTIVNLSENVQITLDITDAGTLRVIDSATIELSEIDPQEVQSQVMQKLGVMLGLQESAEINSMLAGLTDDPEAYKLYIQGEGFLQKSDDIESMDEAIRLFEQAIERDSTFALAYAGAGRAYGIKYLHGRDIASIRLSLDRNQEALRLNDNLSEVWSSVSKTHELTGDYEEALSAAEKAVALDPNNFDANLRLAKAYSEMEEYEKSVPYLDKAIALQPNNWQGYLAYGGMYSDANEPEKAIPLYEKVIELRPGYSGAYMNLGIIYRQIGDLEKAEQWFLKSVEIRPHALGYNHLGWDAWAKGSHNKAVEYFLEATKLAPDDEIWFLLLGDAYMVVGDMGNAQRAWEQTIERVEERMNSVGMNETWTLTSGATAHARLGQYDESRDYIERYLTIEPKTAEYYYELALLYEYVQDREQAVAYLDIAYEKGYPLNTMSGVPWLSKLEADPAYQALLTKYQ